MIQSYVICNIENDRIWLYYISIVLLYRIHVCWGGVPIDFYWIEWCSQSWEVRKNQHGFRHGFAIMRHFAMGQRFALQFPGCFFVRRFLVFSVVSPAGGRGAKQPLGSILCASACYEISTRCILASYIYTYIYVKSMDSIFITTCKCSIHDSFDMTFRLIN